MTKAESIRLEAVEQLNQLQEEGHILAAAGVIREFWKLEKTLEAAGQEKAAATDTPF